MNIIAWLVVGALAGWIGGKIMKTKGSMGWITNIIVGILGAFIGGFVFNLIGKTGVTGFNLWSIFVSVVGSVILLAIAKLITGRSG